MRAGEWGASPPTLRYPLLPLPALRGGDGGGDIHRFTNMTMTISVGRARGLQASATARGIFTILAIDHRESLQIIMNPDAPAEAPVGETKMAVIRHLAPLTSAVLLDAVHSAAQSIAAGALPGHVGLLLALEEETYGGDESRRETMLVPGWSVEKAKRLGASGVKIFLFYHPDGGALTEKQEGLVRGVLADCARYDIPLFLEPISHPLDAGVDKRSADFARERKRIVVESARRLSDLKPDVLKVEFPVDPRYESDEAAWHAACAELNEASAAPWALLSGDEPFDTFKQQVRVACEEGCSGFLAGRAVWREAATLTGAARDDFLVNTARRRLEELVEIADQYGKPWQSRYVMPSPDENWYAGY